MSIRGGNVLRGTGPRYHRRMLLQRDQSVLILVDYQARLMPAIHEGAQVVRQAVWLAQVARALGVPVWATEQNPRALGGHAPELLPWVDHILPKMHFSAVADGLVAAVRAQAPQARQWVMAGCETHVCLLQTALEARQAGVQVAVVPQACGSRRPDDKALALQRLTQAGVALVAPEMVAFEWMRGCEHPAFREVLGLIKSAPV